MSHELVPTIYDRHSYNVLHGVETRHHTDKLTAEQAEQINENFDIYVLPMRHGYGLDQDQNALENGNAPGNDDYDHAANTVNAMAPGDVLFVESVGFGEEHGVAQQTFGKKIAGVLSRVYETQAAEPADFDALSEEKKRLESDRKNYMIDAIQYATEYALLGGIKIVFADMDVYESDKLSALVAESGYDVGGAPTDKGLLERANTARERRAINTIKDFALEELEYAKPIDERQKQRLVLLYGSTHADRLKQGFDNLGLASFVLAEAIDDPVKRHAEFAGHLAVKQAA